MRPNPLVVTVALALLSADAAAAQDIYLARIAVDAAGKVTVEAPINITNRPGYDNQPSFSPDGRKVFYTSTREDQQADIYSYDIESKAITRLTKTAPESEYSALVMPGGTRFSVIRVERDSSQRLWSFLLDGSDPQIVVPNVKPVGYHAWVGTANIAMFVLGSPNSLQLYNSRNGRVDTLTTNIGRSLVAVPVPGVLGPANGPDGMFSYVQRDSTGFGVHTVDTRQSPLKSNLVAKLPAGSEYVAWQSTARIITGQGSKLMMYDVTTGTWSELADLTSAGLTRISRLAISSGSRGQWIAIVAEPGQ
jgi:dipeptidyl aminopeptidase/acylaminoacyl peptidase